MEELGVIIGFLALFGTPIASWVIVNRKIAKLEAENKSVDKQLISMEVSQAKEIDRLEGDYKERFEVVKADQEKYEREVDRTLKTIFSKMEENKNDILTKIEGVSKDIVDLKLKLASS